MYLEFVYFTFKAGEHGSGGGGKKKKKKKKRLMH